MRPSRTTWLALALGLAVLGAAVAGVVARAADRGITTVNVTEREYKLALARKPSAGTVRFVVRNKGTIAHALKIAGPGVAKRTALIPPGKTATLVVKLKKGTYHVWCPVPGHAALGMKASFAIGHPAMSTTTSSSATTTTSGSAWG